MSSFEISFALVTLLLGLGLAHIAEAFAQLVVAGRRVRWDWLSPLAAILMFLSALVYWWFQWQLRAADLTLGVLTLRAMSCLALYVMAVATFPTIGEEDVDLRAHFDTSRRLIYSALAVHILLVGVIPRSQQMAEQWMQNVPWDNLMYIALLGVGMIVRARSYHALILSFMIFMIGREWLTQSIAG